MYCADEGWIFVHVQKTGGNSVCTALGRPVRHPDKHMTALWLRDRYGQVAWDSAFKFGFVRNPWDRMVSWWSMFDRCRNSGRVTNAFGRLMLECGSTFEQFLLAFDAMPDDEFFKSEWLFRSQYSMLSDQDGRLIVDVVGRFEHLAQDWAGIALRLGKPGIPLPHVNASRHRPYQEYYSSRTKGIVARHFAADLDAFGYAFDG